MHWIIDRLEIRSIVSNLVNNSVESFENGSGEIRVSCGATENSYYIKVWDNGSGISEIYLEKIGKEPISTKVGLDRGAGLTHAFAVVDKFGGNIKIISTEGMGTTVVLSLLKVSSGNEETQVEKNADIRKVNQRRSYEEPIH